MTAYPFLKDNIEYLQAKGHPVFQWLSAHPFGEEALLSNLFINAYGIHDWRMENGKGMFEALPPVGLYSSWTNGDKPETSATFIVGCNLGYGVNHVLTNTPDSHKVMLVEPRPEMLLACLGQTDYRPFFEAKKFHILMPDERYIHEVVKNLDLQFVYGQIHLKGDLPSQQLGPEYARWATWMRHKLENFSLELSTLRFRQDVMVANEVHNFSRAMAEGSIRGLEGRAAGLGGIILGAGPSLEDAAARLRDNPGHALYVCALQTVPTLQALGIRPHFCVAIDYDKSMLNLFDRLDPDFVQGIPLIYSTKVQPEAVARYAGPTLPLWTVGGMGTYVMKEHDLVIDAGGNVSVTITRLLRWLGVSHMVLIGQDYAWLKDRSHAAGHHNRTTSMARRSYHQTARNMDGEEILTTVQYMTAKRELEEDLKVSPVPVFNVYGGGVPIEGTRVVDLENAYAEGLFASVPGGVERFMAELAASRGTMTPVRFEPRGPVWSSSLRNVEKHLGKLFRNLGANQSAVHEAMGRVEVFLNQDPLYTPYLYNELVDLAGLTRARKQYGQRDFPEFRRIARCVLKKVREIDRLVCMAESRPDQGQAVA